MIGNVNVPGASAADIATVSSVANEALNKANQALNSNGSGNTELNLELSSIKYYPSDFVNMTYKDGYYLVASGKYLYFTSDFSEWNRVVIKKDDSNYTYKYNFVYVVGNMLVCCYVNSSNSLYRQNGFNGFGNNKVDIFTGAQSSGYRNMISMDTISANMSFRRTHDSNGIYSYYNNYYYYSTGSTSNKIQISQDAFTWVNGDDNQIALNSFSLFFDDYNKTWFYLDHNTSNSSSKRLILYKIDKKLNAITSQAITYGSSVDYQFIDFGYVNKNYYIIFAYWSSPSSTYNRIYIKKFETLSNDTTAFTAEFAVELYSNSYNDIGYKAYLYPNASNSNIMYLFASNTKGKYIKSINISTKAITDVDIDNVFVNPDLFTTFSVDSNSTELQIKSNRAPNIKILRINNKVFLLGDRAFPIMQLNSYFKPLIYSKYALSLMQVINDKLCILNPNKNDDKVLSTNDNYSFTLETISKSNIGMKLQGPSLNYSIIPNNYFSYKNGGIIKYSFYYNGKKYIVTLFDVFSYYNSNYDAYSNGYITLERINANGTTVETYISIQPNNYRDFTGIFQNLYIDICMKDENNGYLILSYTGDRENKIGDLVASISRKCGNNSSYFSYNYKSLQGSVIIKFNLSNSLYSFIQKLNDFDITTQNTLDKVFSYNWSNVCCIYNNNFISIGPYASLSKDNIRISNNLPFDMNPLGLFKFGEYLITYSKDKIMYSSNGGITWLLSDISYDIPNNIAGMWYIGSDLYLLDDQNCRYKLNNI